MASKIGFDKAQFDRIVRKLDVIPKEMRSKSMQNVYADALRPARNQAKSTVRRYAKKGSGYSKASFVARAIKVFKVMFKGTVEKEPGATLRVGGRGVGDIWVYNRPWMVAGYARVIEKGSQGKDRHWRTKSRKYTGKVDGIGDFILSAVKSNFPFMVRYAKRGVEKEFKRIKKRLGFL